METHPAEKVGPHGLRGTKAPGERAGKGGATVTDPVLRNSGNRFVLQTQEDNGVRSFGESCLLFATAPPRPAQMVGQMPGRCRGPFEASLSW